MKTLIGVFGNPRSAQRAMMMLRDRGLVLDALSTISRSPTKGVSVRSVGTTSSSRGAVIGVVWGAILALISLLVPGVGQFMGIGVLAIIATMLIGALLGAAAGAVAAALLRFGGIPQAEAQTYEPLLQGEKTLVAVKVRDKDRNHVRRTLSKAGAEQIQDDQSSAAVALQTRV